MISKLSIKTVEWQIQKGYLKDEDRAAYQYAYELLIARVINLVLAILIAYVFHAFIIVLTFMLAYIPLRTYAGGYHARTNERCMVVSAMIICAACLFVQWYPSAYILPFNVIGCSIATVILWLLAPVEDANKSLDVVEFRRYRFLARVVWCTEMAVCWGTYLIGWESVSLTVALSGVVVVGMLGVGKAESKNCSL